MSQPKSNESLIEEWYQLNDVHVSDLEKEQLVKILNQKDKEVEEAVAEYKQFVVNVLDGIDIADGQCNTKAIRFALQSRIILTPQRVEVIKLTD